MTQETIANSGNNGQINYNYDAVGNRLQRTSSVGQVQNQSSSFDANDRINSDTFDDNGNTKQSNGRQFNYDFENKLTSTLDGITIVYDGDGNRVSKTVNGVTTKYLVDTNNLTGYAQVVEEIVGGQITKQYTYGLDLISQKQGVIVSFYNYDGHGSVRNLTNQSAQITDSYDYDAFGTLINRTGTTDNNYLYAGEQFDADLGFYYNRARYLNVETGRFVSMDSYEGSSNDPLSLHKYLYANSDGVNNIDPSGQVSIAQALIVVNIIGTLASILFQNTTRAYAPGNDPFENYNTEVQADYRDAQINLAFLIFALASITAGARSTAGTVAGSGTKVRVAPYNPSNGNQNCAACVSAVIRTRRTNIFTTADDIEAIKPLPNLPNARATADYIEETAGVTLADSSLNAGAGHYVIVRQPTSAEPLGHVVYGYVSRNGARYILDPQTHRSYRIILGQDLSPDVRAIIGSNPVIMKVLE